MKLCYKLGCKVKKKNLYHSTNQAEIDENRKNKRTKGIILQEMLKFAQYKLFCRFTAAALKV
jgi:hypothetical protein